MTIIQFYDVNNDAAYCNGWPFDADSMLDTQEPEKTSQIWVKVKSRTRSSVSKLRKEAMRIYNSNEQSGGHRRP